MSATRSIHARLALAASGIVTAGSFAGSATALYKIANEAQMDAAWSLPISLDLVAMAAASARAARPTDRFAQGVLFLATVVSLALQVCAAPPSLAARVAHGAPVIAAYLSFELALRSMETAPAAEVAPTVETTNDGASTAPPPPAAPPVPAGPARRPRASYLELLPVAERVAADLAAEGAKLSRRAFQGAMEAAGHPVASSGTADKLLAHLRASWAVEGVAA